MHKAGDTRADTVLVNRSLRTASAVVLAVLAAVAVACVPPPAPPAPPVPTTAPPSTTESPSPRERCEAGLAAFAEAANAGTITNPAFTIDIAGVTPLDNPETSSATTDGDDPALTLDLTAYDEDGDPVVPTADRPITLTVYGGGGAITAVPRTGVTADGTDPLVLEITAGTEIELAYDGSFLPAPPTLQAQMRLGVTNGCTGTSSWSVGAATVPLEHLLVDDGSASANLPALCDDGPPGECATETVASTGIRLAAAVGHADPDDFQPFTVDTGSIGVAVPIAELGTDAVGPAGPAYRFYDSSGYEYMGFVYLAPVTFRDAGGDTVSSIPVRVLGVQTSGCVPGYGCTTAPDPTSFRYLGVGFDRNVPSSAVPFASPTDNALLQLQAPDGGHYAQGYVLSGTGARVGLTPGQRFGIAFTSLNASTDVPGDWQTAPGFVSLTRDGVSSGTLAAGVLIDTGITDMFIDVEPGTDGFDELRATDTVTAMVADSDDSPQLQYSFVVGTDRVPAATGMNPSRVSLLHRQTSGAFVNTGRYVLFEHAYLFDARHGEVGFRALSPPLR
jgi:hypothetical protein